MRPCYHRHPKAWPKACAEGTRRRRPEGLFPQPRFHTHHPCCVSTQALPRTLVHDDLWTTTPHPRPRQEREARIALSVSSSAKRTASSTSPPPRGNARVIGGGAHAGTRARSALAIGAERAARGRDWAAAGAWARSAHAIGAERVARGGDGSQRLRRPAHRRAAPSARSAVRRAPSERVAQAEIRLAAGAGRTAPTPPAPAGMLWADSNAGRYRLKRNRLRTSNE